MISGHGIEREVIAQIRQTGASLNTAASAAMVNRTHRVVRERAARLREEKSRWRSLFIPLTVSFGMLALVVCALWSLFEESELFVDGMPDSSQQMMFVSVWFLPLSAIVLAVVWFRRSRTRNGAPR